MVNKKEKMGMNVEQAPNFINDEKGGWKLVGGNVNKKKSKTLLLKEKNIEKNKGEIKQVQVKKKENFQITFEGENINNNFNNNQKNNKKIESIKNNRQKLKNKREKIKERSKNFSSVFILFYLFFLIFINIFI